MSLTIGCVVLQVFDGTGNPTISLNSIQCITHIFKAIRIIIQYDKSNINSTKSTKAFKYLDTQTSRPVTRHILYFFTKYSRSYYYIKIIEYFLKSISKRLDF